MAWQTARSEYLTYVRQFAETIPNSERNFEALVIDNSTHLDQTDEIMYNQFEYAMFNMFSGGVSMVKQQGSNIEFHEFLAILWLDFLLKIGHHNNTFTKDNLQERLSQFSDSISYDYPKNGGM